MKKKYRPLPSRLAELRERDPVRFLQACRNGGRNATRKRGRMKAKIQQPTSDEIWAEVDATRAFELAEKVLKEASRIAHERRDHLLPDP